MHNFINITHLFDKKGFIVSPKYDCFFFIGSPLLGFLLAIPFSYMSIFDQIIGSPIENRTIGTALLGVIIMSHLFIVFFRSHLNPDIFKLYPIRFIYVPILLLLSITFSIWTAVIVGVIATWWDVYHSGLQTFGLGRIYDMKAGNDAYAGRRLDYLLNLLIYAGPILAGATLMAHLSDLEDFHQVSFAYMTELPSKIFYFRDNITMAVILIGVPFIIYYIYAYWRLYKQGYTISIQKVVLLAITALCSIFAWGFNTFGEAFFIMNFFHALQYFAIVWHFEKNNMQQQFGLDNVNGGKKFTFILFLMVGIGYGIWAETTNADIPVLYAATLTVSILHFWYDGFIWSVRKKQV